MKRRIKSLVLVVTMIMTMFAMTGCGGSKTVADNGELNIFVWTEYVPEAVIEKFENETGIKVNMSTFSSNEDMLAKVKSENKGTFDIVQPSDYMVKEMIDQDMLAKLDKAKLTNFSNLGKQYLDQNYDKGNVYSVPYQGGVGAIAVNTSKVKDTITSYADLFKPTLKSSMVVLDDYRAVIGMTSKSMGLSMNETDKATLAKVKDKLMTLKSNIKLYDSDSPKSALISGDCTMAYCWSAEVALAMEENPDIKIVYPKEGAYKFMDNWCVTKEAKNSENAMKFINYMLSVDTAKAVMTEFPYLNPNEVALKEMGDEFISNPAKNPPADVMNAGEYVKSLDTDTLKIYDEMWTDLKQ